jgi:23S rRNA pseudouridine2605 synthase
VAEEKEERLQVFLAHSGAASRRAAEKIILEGRVTVNGAVVQCLGTKAGIKDVVLLDGKIVKPEAEKHYLVLNKPPRFLCSQTDAENRPLARDLLPRNIKCRLYNVGRLDFLSSGLIFFTNDGDFARKLSHPSSRIEKEYFVEATGRIPDALVDAFKNGVTVEGVHYKALSVERAGLKSVNICLVEGKNREIRRVFSHFHLHPRRLLRFRIGPVQLDGLAEGQSRPISDTEKKLLL